MPETADSEEEVEADVEDEGSLLLGAGGDEHGLLRPHLRHLGRHPRPAHQLALHIFSIPEKRTFSIYIPKVFPAGLAVILFENHIKTSNFNSGYSRSVSQLKFMAKV